MLINDRFFRFTAAAGLPRMEKFAINEAPAGMMGCLNDGSAVGMQRAVYGFLSETGSDGAASIPEVSGARTDRFRMILDSGICRRETSRNVVGSVFFFCSADLQALSLYRGSGFSGKMYDSVKKSCAVSDFDRPGQKRHPGRRRGARNDL